MTTETQSKSLIDRAYETARDAGKEALEEFLVGVNAIKINRASLQAEATLLRNKAHDAKGMERHALNAHRTGRLRSEARAAHLAWGYLRGRPYSRMEQRSMLATAGATVHKGTLYFATDSTEPGRIKPIDLSRVAAKIILAGFDTPTEEDLVGWVMST